jgi:hypothetical protein
MTFEGGFILVLALVFGVPLLLLLARMKRRRGSHHLALR